MKQADVVVSYIRYALMVSSDIKAQLLTYPLEYHQDISQGEKDLEFYALSTSPNGPGMT